MRAVELELGRIPPSLPRRSQVEAAVVEKIDALEPGLGGSLENVERILEPIDATDLVAIIRRYWKFFDALTRHNELNDDFRVEMENVRIPIEGEYLQSRNRVNPVPA